MDLTFNGADFGDIFGDNAGDILEAEEAERCQNNGPMKGANIRTSVHITFEEAVFGCRKKLT